MSITLIKTIQARMIAAAMVVTMASPLALAQMAETPQIGTEEDTDAPALDTPMIEEGSSETGYTQPLTTKTSDDVMYVSPPSLNVRTGAGLENAIETKLTRGDVVRVYAKEGDWAKITHGSSEQDLWVYAPLLSQSKAAPLFPESPSPKPEAADQGAQTDDAAVTGRE